MIQRILLWVSTICTVIVVLSFVLFAVEEAGAGSKTQQNLIEQINSPNPTPHTEQERELKHTWARERIDDANDVLVSPFSEDHPLGEHLGRARRAEPARVPPLLRARCASWRTTP